MYRFQTITEEQTKKALSVFADLTDKIQRATNWTKIPGNGLRTVYFADNGIWHYLDTVGDEKTYEANPSGHANLKQEIFFANRVPIFSISYGYDLNDKLINVSCWNGGEWGYYDLTFNSVGIPTFSEVKCKLPSSTSMLKGISIQLSDAQFTVDRTYELQVWAYDGNASWPNETAAKHMIATDSLTLQACEVNNILQFDFNVELSASLNYFIHLSTTGQPFPLKTLTSRNMLVKANQHGTWTDQGDIYMTVDTEAIQPPVMYTNVKMGFSDSGLVSNMLFRLSSSSFPATDFLFRFMKLIGGNPWPTPSVDVSVLDVPCSSVVDPNGSYLSIPMSVPVSAGEFYYLEIYRTGGGSFPMKLLSTTNQSAGAMINGVWTQIGDVDRTVTISSSPK